MDLGCVRLVGETRSIEITDVDEVLPIDDNNKHLLLGQLQTPSLS
jgi:hypothetical protein